MLLQEVNIREAYYGFHPDIANAVIIQFQGVHHGFSRNSREFRIVVKTHHQLLPVAARKEIPEVKTAANAILASL